MKSARIYIVALMLLAALAAAAQKGLSVASVFDGRYRDDPNARETVISGGALARHKIDLYRSLTFLSPDAATASEVEKVVRQDGARATAREVQYKDGNLFYGFYTLTRKNNKNRYILYLNQLASGGDKIIVIYLEGAATGEQVKKMLK